MSRLSRCINGLEVVKPDSVRMVGIKEELEHFAVPLQPSPISMMGYWLQRLIGLLSQVTIILAVVLVLYLAAVSKDSSFTLSNLCSVSSKKKT